MKITDLDTPVLALDLDTLERNIQDRAAYCREQGIRVRPHVKTHKCPAIAHLQMEAGAIGITCQKLGEAEVMVQAGIKDILIPYNIVGRVKLERLMRLCRQARMTVAADSEDTVRGISEAASAEGLTVPVIVEIDTGEGRCGVQTPEAVVVLAEAIRDLPGVTFQGIMTHPSQKESGPMLRGVRFDK
jgi:D-serine deaminase-like pyridoxal phosphate-dependent protein